MKKTALAIVLLLSMISCKGSTELPVTFQVEAIGDIYTEGGRAIHIIDRKIVSAVLDTTIDGVAVLELRLMDKMVIDGRQHDIPWILRLRLYEGQLLKIKNFRNRATK